MAFSAGAVLGEALMLVPISAEQDFKKDKTSMKCKRFSWLLPSLQVGHVGSFKPFCSMDILVQDSHI